MSDHFDGRKFFNPGGGNPRGFHALLRWQFNRRPGAWPAWVENPAQPRLPEQVGAGECAVTYVNHVTFLLQFAGLNVLTDPVWSERVSPFTFAGPKRVHAPGLAFEQLPRIDLVLVSHNHYDHLDVATLRRLHAAHRPLVVTTLGNRDFLAGAGVPGAIELDWWQEHAPRPGVKVTITPAQHFAARTLTDRFETLWGGYTLETPAGKIYFAGDSGYFDGFREIGRRLGPFDLAFIPIGAYEPRWFMEPVHCTPAEALMIHRDVRARRSLAMHFGCFPLADDGFDQPVRDLEAARPAHGIDAAEFGLPVVGETRVYRFG
jgi:L-ascorbate metabolism protein UlaG (beta-lactamase superfamily)